MTNTEPNDPRPSEAMTSADLANGEGLPPAADRDASGRSCVVIAVDDSDGAVEIARRALHVLGPDARYVLVSVGREQMQWATDPVMWGAVPPAMVVLSPATHETIRLAADDTAPTAADAAQATASFVASSAGLATAEAVGVAGNAIGDAICSVARDEGADVIVIGHGHRGWFDRLLFGSTTNDVLRRAQCPVLVVPE